MRSAVPWDSSGTSARSPAHPVAALSPTARATLFRGVAYALPASQVQTVRAPARKASTGKVAAGSVGAGTTQTAITSLAPAAALAA